MYFVKTPMWVQSLCPQFLWRMPTEDKVIYLTFDDGPTPKLTDEVLDVLQHYDARATFFVVGDNVSRYPQLMERIRLNGHAIGNHTFHHLNGLLTPTTAYLSDIELCRNLVDSNLFRPPYGLIRRRQAQQVARQFRMVMWDVLSGDFDPSLSRERCLRRVTKLADRGSIVVFHDSMKAADRMLYALPRMLEYFTDRSYRFSALPAVAGGRPNFAGASHGAAH